MFFTNYELKLNTYPGRIKVKQASQMNILKKFTSRLVQISSLRLCIFQIFITTFSVAQPITYSKRFQPTLMTYQAYSCLHFNLMFF